MNRLLDFFDGAGRDGAGRTHADILAFSDAELERHHDFVQWLFPNPKPSPVTPSAPTLTAEDSRAIADSPERKARALAGFDRMLAFYGFRREGADIGPHDGVRSHWLRPGDHNHLRITRILTFLRMIDEKDLARSWLARLDQLPHDSVSPTTRRFWRSAVE